MLKLPQKCCISNEDEDKNNKKSQNILLFYIIKHHKYNLLRGTKEKLTNTIQTDDKCKSHCQPPLKETPVGETEKCME